MKKEIDPKMAIGIIAALVVVVGVVVWAGTATQKANKEPPGMPPAVAAEFQKRMQGSGMSVSGPGAVGGARVAGSGK